MEPVQWNKKKTYYYGALKDDPYFPIKWTKTSSLYDAVMGAKKLVPKSETGEVEIQTRPTDVPVGSKIPSYRVGCVVKSGRNYIYCHYIAKSFNVRVYSKNYLINGEDIIEIG